MMARSATWMLPAGPMRIRITRRADALTRGRDRDPGAEDLVRLVSGSESPHPGFHRLRRVALAFKPLSRDPDGLVRTAPHQIRYLPPQGRAVAQDRRHAVAFPPKRGNPARPRLPCRAVLKPDEMLDNHFQASGQVQTLVAGEVFDLPGQVFPADRAHQVGGAVLAVQDGPAHRPQRLGLAHGPGDEVLVVLSRILVVWHGSDRYHRR